MLAINHATLATAVVLAGSIYFNQPFFLPLIILVIFASIAPDVDHPNSELGSKFTFLSAIFPHRGVTHSFFGVAVFSALIYFGFGLDRIFSYILILITFIGANFAQQLILKNAQKISRISKKLISAHDISFIVKISGFVINLFLASLVFLVWKNELRNEMLILLTAGYFLHIVGDFVTIEGVPLFWPLKKKIGLKLFKTGGVIESIIGVGLAFANIYLLIIFTQQFGVLNSLYWLEYVGY